MKTLIFLTFLILAPVAAQCAVNFEPIFNSTGGVRAVNFEVWVSTEFVPQNILIKADEMDLSLDANGDFVRKNQILNEVAKRYKDRLKAIRDEEQKLKTDKEVYEGRKAKIRFTINEDDFKEQKAGAAPRP